MVLRGNCVDPDYCTMIVYVPFYVTRHKRVKGDNCFCYMMIVGHR